MSAGVDQRKGQSNQGSNGTEKQPEFDYMQGHHQAYGANQMNSPNADPYMSSYYTQYMFPNMPGQDGMGGTWSNGSDPMSLLGGYGQMNGEYMSGNGMYSGFDYNNFGWGFPGGDFQAWGAQRKDDQQGYTETYYNMAPREAYTAMNGEMEPRDNGVRSVETGLKGMNISDKGDGRDGGGHQHHSSSGGGSGSHSGGSSSHSGGHGGHSSGGHSGGGGGGSGAPKKMSWASVASQPARPQPQMKPKSIPRAPLVPGKHNMDIGTWEGRNNPAKGQNPGGSRQAWGSAGRGRTAPPAPYSAGPAGQGSTTNSSMSAPSSGASEKPAGNVNAHPVLEKLKSNNAYNPKEFNLAPKGARFFIIKSYSEDDIHRSIKYSIWCSTEHGNKRLDSAYREREGKGPIYLFFSVNGSGHFCGMAQMLSPLDYHSSSSVWAQDKWKGRFDVKWIYVKDVPNSQLRHIRLENNENKPVTNSRDTQEVPPEKGKLVLKILHHYRHTTSIFDDFNHYEKRQEEEAPPVEKKGGEEGDERRDDRRDDRGHRDDRRDDRGQRDMRRGPDDRRARNQHH